MNIVLLTIGKLKNKNLSEVISIYTERLRHYIPYEIVELPDIRNSGKYSKEEIKTAEGQLILSKILPNDFVILLDERGNEYTSIEFSKHIQNIISAGKKRMVLIVGGPFGFSKEVYDRIPHRLSLSKMTFSHEMVRLFISEQIYRAMTILRGESYHHE